VTAVAYFERIESARTPSDLFEDADKARAVYRRLSKHVHPDVNPGEKARAEQAFARLSELWAQFNGKTVSSPVAKERGLVYETKRGVYVIGDLIARGDISNVYGVEYNNVQLRVGALKMPRNPANNDLVENEIRTLKLLKEKVPEQFRMYHPTVVDTFAQRDQATTKTRRAVILEHLDGFVSLQDVIDAYPDGIDGRHVAWIARRLWIAMDTAHNAGVAHGAVFPEHVMVHPTMHGVVLIDWSYSQEKGEKLTSAVPSRLKQGWYGSNYDKPLDHRLDVHQAAWTLESLLPKTGARPFRAFFNGCRVASAPTAGELFVEFDELLTRIYGKRKYIPFTMPHNWKKVP
jgi:serine/threonine protein kinase